MKTLLFLAFCVLITQQTTSSPIEDFSYRPNYSGNNQTPQYSNDYQQSQQQDYNKFSDNQQEQQQQQESFTQPEQFEGQKSLNPSSDDEGVDSGQREQSEQQNTQDFSYYPQPSNRDYAPYNTNQRQDYQAYQQPQQDDYNNFGDYQQRQQLGFAQPPPLEGQEELEQSFVHQDLGSVHKSRPHGHSKRLKLSHLRFRPTEEAEQ